MIESWIVQSRRKTCLRCERLPKCDAAGIIHSIFREQSACPLRLHPTRLDAVAARAWPGGAQPISGCCDPPN